MARRSKHTYEQITREIATDDGLNAFDTMMFHHSNPNGLLARKTKLNNIIAMLVDAGIVKSGWHLAYGSFADFAWKQMSKMVMRKNPPSWRELQVWISMSREECDKIDARIDEEIKSIFG